MQARARQTQHEAGAIWDAIWRDKRGKIVLYQHPNPVLIGWVIVTLASIFTTGHLSTILWYVALALLAVWSLLEVVKGVNYFRRAMGAVVLILIIAALFKLGY